MHLAVCIAIDVVHFQFSCVRLPKWLERGHRFFSDSVHSRVASAASSASARASSRSSRRDSCPLGALPSGSPRRRPRSPRTPRPHPTLGCGHWVIPWKKCRKGYSYFQPSNRTIRSRDPAGMNMNCSLRNGQTKTEAVTRIFLGRICAIKRAKDLRYTGVRNSRSFIPNNNGQARC